MYLTNNLNETTRYLLEEMIEDKTYKIFLNRCLLDVSGITILIDFFNNNKNINWRIHALVIRHMSIVLYEIAIMFDLQEREKEYLKNVKNLRHKVHQFDFKKFRKQLERLEKDMGRSREISTPCLDIVIDFQVVNGRRFYFATNIWRYYLKNDRLQELVNEMQKIFRMIDDMSKYKDTRVPLVKCNNLIDIKSYSYCYVDILKSSLIKNTNLLDRIILATDELASLKILLHDTIDYKVMMKNNLHMTYFVCKLMSIIFDETVDNINNFLKYNKCDDALVIIKIFDSIDKNVIDNAEKFRNNLHYGHFESYGFKSIDEFMQYFVHLIEEIASLHNSLTEILNINPSNFKLQFYRFLRWTQS